MGDPSVTRQLDVTQFQDMSDTQLLQLGLTSDEIATLRTLPRTKLSSMIPLVVAAGKKKAEHIAEILPSLPEIDVNGNRRCVFIDSKGTRCERYGGKDLPCCKKHTHAASSLGTYFQSPKLREIFNAHVASPDRLRSDGELALMRTMLSTLLSKLNEDNINIEVIGAVSVLADKITGVVERINKAAAITPDDLQKLMVKMVEVAAEYVPADKLDEFAKKVENIDMEDHPLRLKAGVRFEPGEDIDGVKIEDVSMSPQKKALLETAVRMGVSSDF